MAEISLKLHGAALITEEGEAIEGDALEDVKVHGVLTHTLNRASDDRELFDVHG
jgi:DNA polymerase V